MFFFLHNSPPPFQFSIWMWIQGRGRDARPALPALIHPTLFNTRWQHWKDLFFCIPPSLSPSASDLGLQWLFYCKLCKWNKKKIPSWDFGLDGGDTAGAPPNPKQFSFPFPLSWHWNYNLPQSLHLQALKMKVDHEHNWVTDSYVGCLYLYSPSNSHISSQQR